MEKLVEARHTDCAAGGGGATPTRLHHPAQHILQALLLLLQLPHLRLQLRQFRPLLQPVALAYLPRLQHLLIQLLTVPLRHGPRPFPRDGLRRVLALREQHPELERLVLGGGGRDPDHRVDEVTVDGGGGRLGLGLGCSPGGDGGGAGERRGAVDEVGVAEVFEGEASRGVVLLGEGGLHGVGCGEGEKGTGYSQGVVEV
mmetsp:Transcript_5328/g.13872  ORF Transcript_5328/g.13872 Transcript_5328/m.13872 type:complete len:200 (+) Transcript_5328:47-646(+)